MQLYYSGKNMNYSISKLISLAARLTVTNSVLLGFVTVKKKLIGNNTWPENAATQSFFLCDVQRFPI